MTHSNIHYSFEPTEVESDGIKWTSSLVGTYDHNKERTVLSNPYELVVGLKSLRKTEITNVQLVASATGKVLLSDVNPKPETAKARQDGELIQLLTYKGITIEHKDMKIIIEYSCTGVKKNIILYLKARYKEFKSNRILDEILAI